jgi:hypothetical protein
MNDVIYDITSWLVERMYEDHLGSAEVFSVAAVFGTRTFVHSKSFDDRAKAEDLLARIQTAAPSAEHIHASRHWGPHPYCDGTLEQRLAVEADVEAQERHACNTGTFCDTDKVRQAAAEDIIEEPEDVEALNDLADGMAWAADRAMTHAPTNDPY